MSKPRPVWNCTGQIPRQPVQTASPANNTMPVDHANDNGASVGTAGFVVFCHADR